MRNQSLGLSNYSWAVPMLKTLGKGPGCGASQTEEVPRVNVEVRDIVTSCKLPAPV